MKISILIYGIGWCFCGITDLIFSFKTITRKIEKYKEEYEINKICSENKITGISYLLFGIGLLTAWAI